MITAPRSTMDSDLGSCLQYQPVPDTAISGTLLSSDCVKPFPRTFTHSSQVLKRGSGAASAPAPLSHARPRGLRPPELLVAGAHERFDAELERTHEGTRRVLSE